MSKNIRPKLKADLMVNLLIIWPPEKLLQKYVLYSRPFLFSVRFVLQDPICALHFGLIFDISDVSHFHTHRKDIDLYIYLFIHVLINQP